jgi:hypothetical protein
MSSEFTYNEGVLTGWKTDGVFKALPPAPTGDSLDEILDECCRTIENLFGAFKRLHGELQLSDGQHSLILTDGVTGIGLSRGHEGVRSWITSGSLRSSDELSPVLNAFMSDMAKKVRLRKVEPDWKFDNDALIILGSRFGLQTPRTFAELAAKRQADAIAREQRKADEAEVARVTREEYLTSPEGKAETRRNADQQLRREILEEVLTAIVGEFDPIHLGKDSTDAEVNAARAKLLGWKQDISRLESTLTSVINTTKWSAEAIITIWREADQQYTELVEQFDDDPRILNRLPPLEDFCMRDLVKKANEVTPEPVQLTPSSIPPVIDGVERTLMSRQQWLDETRTNGDAWFLDDVRTVVRMDDGQTFVIDKVPETLWDEYEAQCRVHEDFQRLAAQEEK